MPIAALGLPAYRHYSLVGIAWPRIWSTLQLVRMQGLAVTTALWVQGQYRACLTYKDAALCGWLQVQPSRWSMQGRQDAWNLPPMHKDAAMSGRQIQAPGLMV